MEKPKIEFTESEIRIYDSSNKEIVMWTKSEWEEDSDVVFPIIHAICLAHTDIEKLKKLISK